jgi:hypothetical protein
VASDIVPIRVSLTAGDFVTLWAPRWREDGEEWEAFLGGDDAVFGFPTVAHLAAFVRTAGEHDLVDHPAWSVVPQLTVDELIPEETHRYDVIGVPALAAEDPDTWTIGELAEITSIVRSLAEVCELGAVHAVLDSTDGFALLDRGTVAFAGREGARLWTELSATIVDRWDEVIDALDALVRTPEVDPEALLAARNEPAGLDATASPTGPRRSSPSAERPAGEGDDTALDVATFWLEVGIDPIRITTADDELYTLRCYLDEEPVFLGSDGTIVAFRSLRALVRYLAGDGARGHDLAQVLTWPEVVERATGGELAAAVDQANDYLLLGLDADLAEGPLALDPTQLELAAELLRDAGQWAGDDEPAEALAESDSLGWLLSFVIQPDPTRMAPSPPFDREVARWRELVDDFTKRLQVHS